MKYLYTLLFLSFGAHSFSQCQITIQPGPNEGKDNRVFNLPCTSSYAQQTGRCDTSNWGDHPEMSASEWTYLGTPGKTRTLIEFNLDSLANAGCTVSEAILVLQPTGSSNQYNCGSGSTIVNCVDNSMKINRIDTSWGEYTTSGNNVPTFANTVPGQDYVIVPNENDPYDSYAIDLTDMVNFWLMNPSLNHGMILSTLSNTYYQSIFFASSDHPDAWRRPKLVLTTHCQNSCSNLISGTVYDDVNSNCQQDTGENGLENWLVKIEPGPIYATTDSNGYYEAWVANANYTVTQTIPNNYLWDSICPLPYDYQIDLTSGGNAPNTDFAVHADNYCAELSVDIGASFLRKCHTEIFYVSYCNDGNLDETGVYIDIEFDSELTPLSSTLPWQSVNGNTYSFWVGNLDAGECGTFSLETQVSCNTNFGDVECVKANIYPQNSCSEPIDPQWDKSSVMVTGVCDGDSLACFTITNTGDIGNGDMDGTSEYRIYENNVLVHIGTFQLQGQDDTVICWPTNGNTIQLQADQRPGHPGNSNPNAIIDGCGTSNGNSCGIQCINGLTSNDADPYVEIECLEVVASYDPNDKTPNPLGYDVERFIGDDDMIEYKIRFQNTGNDTAFQVVLRDKIDQSTLDITSIQTGVSSHPYTFDIYGDGILKWTFDNIELVDSATNEDASIGFVKFKINQKSGNAPGTVIENFVDIYFDYNSPVRTDTAFNTIEFPKNLSVPYFFKENIELMAYPNPTDGLINFEINKVPQDDYRLVVMDLQGRLVKETTFNNLKTVLDLSDVNDGIYFYELVSHEGKLASGKVIVSH